MSYVPEGEEEPPHLRRLRLLVMILGVVLILGIVTIAATIVIRLGFAEGGKPVARGVSASSVVLPEGHTIIATGQGVETLHVTTRNLEGVEMIRIFDAESGVEISRTKIERR